MAVDYIPEADIPAADWMRELARGVLAAASTYGISQEMAEATDVAVQAYRDALAVATRPTTRTRGAVATKTIARQNAERWVRRVAQAIRVNDDISDSLRLEVGLRPVNKRRSRVAAPQSVPRLNFLPSIPGAHRIKYRDSDIGIGRARPKSAVAMQLFEYLADDRNEVAPTDEAMQKALRLRATVTNNPFTLRQNRADAGKKVVYLGRWVSRRGEVGAFGPPLAVNIAA